MSETALMRAILVELSKRGVMAWRANSGVAVSAAGNAIRFNVPGCADIIGVIPPNGRLLACEVKAQRGRLTPQQRKFGEAIAARGGLWVIARSVEDAVMAVEHAMGSAASVGWVA